MCPRNADLNYVIVRGPDANRHVKLLTQFAVEGSLSGAYSQSALGIGKSVLDDRTEIAFPQHLHLDFDFRAAFADNTIREIIAGPRCDEDFLRTEMRRLGSELVPRDSP